MRTRGLIVAALLALASLAPAGCKHTPSATPTAGVTVGGPAGGGTPAGSPTPTVAATRPAALPTGGKCALITAAQAGALLGGPATGLSADHHDTDIVHIDGCAYRSAAGNLGYDVNDYSRAGVATMSALDQARAVMGQAPGVKPFQAPGGDGSVAFTMPIGGKVMARIEIAAGSYLIAVNATAGGADRAQQVALGAAAILVAAVG